MSINQAILVAADSSMEDLVTEAISTQTNLTVVPTIETLDKLREQEIDVLIMTDGAATTNPLDLTQEIRREFPTLPMGFISESDSGVLASEALAAGADDYVPLSVVSSDPDRLQSGLNRAVQARSLSDPSEELTALHTATREMIAADSSEALAERIVEACTDVLELKYASVYRGNDDESTLVPIAWTERLQDLVGRPPLLDSDSLAWPTYNNTTMKYYADASTVEGTPTVGTELRTEMYVPLGDYGLLGVFSSEQDDFNAHEREIISILAANATAALNSIFQTTELRETTQQLKRQNEQLDQFTSIVSHDLRNPLSVAEGYVEMAREEHDSEHLSTVADAHTRMHTLIENLLVLARSGKQIDEVDEVALSHLIEACWGNVATAKATLVTDVDRQIQADRSRLRQLFENLMRNAVEHGGEDVTVSIGALDDGFYFEDDGPGIPSEERDRVFEAGYLMADDGSGLGLNIVKQVAEAHGWNVSVTDGSDGGARFEITGVESAE